MNLMIVTQKHMNFIEFMKKVNLGFLTQFKYTVEKAIQYLAIYSTLALVYCSKTGIVPVSSGPNWPVLDSM